MDDFHCSLFILPEKLQYDIKSVAKQSVLWWSALLLNKLENDKEVVAFMLNNDCKLEQEAVCPLAAE